MRVDPYMLMSSGPFTDRKCSWHSVATALATSVFPAHPQLSTACCVARPLYGVPEDRTSGCATRPAVRRPLPRHRPTKSCSATAGEMVCLAVTQVHSRAFVACATQGMDIEWCKLAGKAEGLFLLATTRHALWLTRRGISGLHAAWGHAVSIPAAMRRVMNRAWLTQGMLMQTPASRSPTPSFS